MFGVGPAYLFILQNRLPIGLMRRGWRPWVSTMATNAAIALVVAVLMWAVGVVPFLLVHLPITLLAASIGVWLFYVQHQFEETAWEDDRTLEPARGRAARQLPLRPAGGAALVLRQYRRPPRPPSEQPHPVLSAGPGAARQSGAARRQPADARAKASAACAWSLWDEAERRLISFREAASRYGSALAALPMPAGSRRRRPPRRLANWFHDCPLSRAR